MPNIEIIAKNINFLDTIKSHGWVCLKPFTWDDETGSLSMTTKIEDSKHKLSIRYSDDHLSVDIEDSSQDNYSPETEQQIKYMITRIFRLDEDLTDFYELCKDLPQFGYVEKENRGRILRCPTLFEDILKTIFTTNCTWKNTEMMAENLCSLCDDCFPGPQEIIEMGMESLKTKVKMGYRAEYVYEFSEKVIDGLYDINSWENIDDTQVLKEKILSVKGIGEYSANHIMMLLGNYSFLPLDSVVGKYLIENYFPGTKDMAPKDLIKPFEKFGKWKYLVFRFDWDHVKKIQP